MDNILKQQIKKEHLFHCTSILKLLVAVFVKTIRRENYPKRRELTLSHPP